MSLMMAATLTEPGRIELREAPVPAPGPGEVRVRIEGCGVCASNLPPWEGRPWFSYPFAPGQLGHEGWGVVDAVGDGVSSVAPGRRVAMLSNHAYAEYDTAPAEHVVPLPDVLAANPLPGEPLGCAFNVFRRSGIGAGHTVAVVGVGFLGALLVRLASRAGARVIALSRRPYSLAVARAMGAAHALTLDDSGEIVERVKELTDGRLCDRVIEAVGKQEPLDRAGELTCERGRLIVAGYHQDGLRQVNMQLWNWRGLDVVNAHERDPRIYVDGIRDAVQAVERGDIDPAPLYTHRYPLERLGEALEAARDRPDGFMKALVRVVESEDALPTAQ